MDKELTELLENSAGPLTVDRIAARLAINVTDAQGRVRDAVRAGAIRNTCEQLIPTYTVNNLDKNRVAQPPMDNIFERDNYAGRELKDTGPRPEARDTDAIPSRMGNWLFYRDGRKEKME